MTKVADSKRIMKAYYGNHNASKDDIALIEKYLARTPEQRMATRAAFGKWFTAHAFVRQVLHQGGESYFYPAFEPYIKDYDAFFSYAIGLRKKIMAGIQQIQLDVKSHASDAVFVDHLRSYIRDLNDFLDHDESITVPMLLEHFTADSYEKLASDYGKRLKPAEAMQVMPWMASRLKPDEKHDVIKLVPWPIQLLYRFLLEPRFLKLMQF